MATTKIQGNAAGSGSVTVTAPNTNSNRTVTLPDADVTLPTAHSQATLTTQGDILYASGANTLARLPKGSWGQALAINRDATAPEWGIGIPTAIVADVKAQNNNGGTFSSGAWRTRDLNTIIHETHADIVTLNSQNMVVPTGTYLFHWSAPGALCNGFVTQLKRTDSGSGTPGGGAATVKAGSVEYASASGDTQSRSMGHAIAIVTSATGDFEIQAYGATTRANDGFGVKMNVSEEIYTYCIIQKIA